MGSSSASANTNPCLECNTFDQQIGQYNYGTQQTARQWSNSILPETSVNEQQVQNANLQVNP